MTKQEKKNPLAFFVWIFFFPIAKFHLTAFPKEHKDLQIKMVYFSKQPEKRLIRLKNVSFIHFLLHFQNLDLGK